MKAFTVFVLLNSLFFLGCSKSPTSPSPSGTMTISSPLAGETYRMGASVIISWTCSGCTGFPTGDFVNVYVYDGYNAYLISTNALFTDTKTWTAGSTLQNISLLPGVYQIVLQDNAQIFTVGSGNFQLVNP